MDRVEYFKFYSFLIGFVIFVGSGYLFSYRKNKVFEKRFVINMIFSAVNSVFIYILLQTIVLKYSFNIYDPSFGVLSYLNLSLWAKFVIGFLILDLMIYWQHRAFHKIPLLWRIHRLHHSDNDFDTSTGLRFHPFEAIISFVNRLFTVYIFGISFYTLIIFEIVLNLASMFNHSNFSLPNGLEKFLKYFLITPDLHRVHHSIDVKDSNHNFGFSLSLWDILFKSFRFESALSFKSENIGVLGYQESKKQSLGLLLRQPFD